MKTQEETNHLGMMVTKTEQLPQQDYDLLLQKTIHDQVDLNNLGKTDFFVLVFDTGEPPQLYRMDMTTHLSHWIYLIPKKDPQ